MITLERNNVTLGRKAPAYLKIFKGELALHIQSESETEVNGTNDFLVRSVLPQRKYEILSPA